MWLCTPGEFFHYPIQRFGVPPSPSGLRLHCLSQDVLTFVIAAFLFYLLVLFLVFCSGHLVPSALLPCLLHPLFTFSPFIDCVPRLFRNPSLFSVSSFEPQHLLARLYDRISPPFPDCIHVLAVFSPGGLFFVLSVFWCSESVLSFQLVRFSHCLHS